MLEATLATARDVMSRDVVIVTPDTPLRTLLRIMSERRISGLPVVDQSGRIVGMVSASDLFRWRDGLEARQEHWLDQLGEGLDAPPAFVDWIQAQHETVRAAMTTGEIATVTEDTPAREIAALMTRRGIQRVPVLRDERIVGIVARSDLIGLLARTLDARAAEQAAAEAAQLVPAADRA